MTAIFVSDFRDHLVQVARSVQFFLGNVARLTDRFRHIRHAEDVSERFFQEKMFQRHFEMVHEIIQFPHAIDFLPDIVAPEHFLDGDNFVYFFPPSLYHGYVAEVKILRVILVLVFAESLLVVLNSP